MFPFVPGGSHLTLEQTQSVRIALGDIVCFIDEDEQLVAHRVVAVLGNVLRVRGDRGGRDECVPVAAIFGRVLHVRRGLLSYATDGAIGRLLAHVVLKRPNLHRAMCHAAEGVMRLRARGLR